MRPHAQERASSVAITPQSLRAEHGKVMQALGEAQRAPGNTGEAARELATVLQPHFQREEEIALPPLGLLRPLAMGEYRPQMQEVLQMTDALREELPRMLEEHQAIAEATRRLESAARQEGREVEQAFAQDLLMHARMEEEVLYPAAILVGDVVRMRSEREEAVPDRPAAVRPAPDAPSCPTDLQDVEVRARDIEGGVSLVFTGPRESVEEVRRLTRQMAQAYAHHNEMMQARADAPMRPGAAPGRGAMHARRPRAGMNMMTPAEIEVRETSEGAELIMVAKNPEEEDALRAQERWHAERMRLGHCPMMGMMRMMEGRQDAMTPPGR